MASAALTFSHAAVAPSPMATAASQAAAVVSRDGFIGDVYVSLMEKMQRHKRIPSTAENRIECAKAYLSDSPCQKWAGNTDIFATERVFGCRKGRFSI